MGVVLVWYGVRMGRSWGGVGLEWNEVGKEWGGNGVARAVVVDMHT